MTATDPCTSDQPSTESPAQEKLEAQLDEKTPQETSPAGETEQADEPAAQVQKPAGESKGKGREADKTTCTSIYTQKFNLSVVGVLL